jgi:DNA-binding Xre family transcriptional regulator
MDTPDLTTMVREIVREEVRAFLKEAAGISARLVDCTPRALRQATGLSVEELAEVSGVSAATIRRIEAGRARRFSRDNTLTRIARALECPGYPAAAERHRQRVATPITQ